MAAARPFLALVCVTLAALSIVQGLPSTVDRLSNDLQEFAGLTSREQREELHHRNGIYPAAVLDFYARQLRPGDTFYIDVPDVPFGVVGLKLAVTAPALYRFLPHVAVGDPRQADVIFSFGRGRPAFPVPVKNVKRMDPLIAAARVDR